MKPILTLFFSLFIVCGYATTTDTNATVRAGSDIYEQEAGYYLNHLDSFVINTYYAGVLKMRSATSPVELNAPVEKPEGRDSIYRIGLAELDKQSPFNLAYNDYVRAFIDLYLYKKRDLTETCLGLADYYFPIFEEALDKHDLPIEFKYLAIVESALNVRARSRAGAAGLWQFMYRTGKYYDLRIDSYVDDRYEIYAATDAACRFFTDLYKVYENWELVIAAYNCGPGNVNKAIRRSGGKKDYWELRPYLPRETRGYVPAFIAVNYAMNYHQQYGLSPVIPDSLNLLTDTIAIKGPFDLYDISDYFCADLNQILYLNPSLKRAQVPEDNKKYTIRLPIGLVNAYLTYNDAFSAYLDHREEIKEEEEEEIRSAYVQRGVQNVHVVRSGEVLGVIAEKYGCRVSQIKDWNNLYTSRIYEGQKLVLYLDKKVEAQPVARPVEKVVPKDNPNYSYHVIRPGDTLWDIANMYDGLTVTELKRLNQGVNYKKLKPGDKLVVANKS